MVATGQRLAAVDLVRFFAALAIVYFHIKLPGEGIALAALNLFVLLSTYFGFGRNMRDRAARLLVPWAIWCAVYLALKLADAALRGHPVAAEFEYWMLLTGPAIHLWYLPFMFLFLASVSALPARVLIPLLYAVAAGTYFLASHVTFAPPFAQWMNVLPSAALGVLMRLTRHPGSLCLAAATVFGLIYLATGADLALLQIISLAALALVASLPQSQTPVSGYLASLSLGIYLVHPIPVSILMMLGMQVNYTLFALVALSSIAAAAAVRRCLPVAV